MSTEVTWNPSSVLLSTNTRAFTGSANQFPVTSVTPLTDAATATFVDVGANGSGGFFTTGELRLNLATVSPLGSGQQIGFIDVRNPGTQPHSVSVSATTFEVGFLNSANLAYTRVLDIKNSPLLVQELQTLPGDGNSDWRSVINNLKLVIKGTRPDTVTGIGTIFNLVARYFVYDRPSLTVTGPASPVTNTLNPTIQWTPAFELGQSHFQVKIFSAAQYSIVGFNPAVSPHTYDSGVGPSSANTHTVVTPLVNGTTYRAYVRAAQTLQSGFLHWTDDQTTWSALSTAAWVQFTIDTAPPLAPSAITPASGATVSTDFPTLGATLALSPVTGVTSRAEWQLATDAGFSNNLRTLLEPAADLRASGPTLQDVVGASEMFQGVWFIRARALDSLGVYGPYSGSHTFTVSHPPNAANLSPTGQVSKAFGSLVVSWTFTDPSPTDAQTAFQVVVERDSDGLVVYDSGKQASSANLAAAPVSGTYKDVLLRWKVRLWDSDDVVGAYSATQQFYLRDAASIGMISPTNGGEVSNPQPTFTWSVTSTNGGVQSAFRVAISSGSVTVVDSGFITGSGTSFTPAVPVLVTGQTYAITITVRDTWGVESTFNGSFDAAWVPPPSPTPAVSGATYESHGRNVITWDANRDQDFTSYAVYRNVVGSNFWLRLGVITDPAPATYGFHDYLSPAGVTVQYAVTQSARRFGVPVESSPVTATQSNQITNPSGDYWLITPDNQATNVRLSLVKDDSYTDEWETNVVMLLGRGRRVERDTHWGIKGQLSATVYDSSEFTAREIKQQLEAIVRNNLYVVMRTPFGDSYEVSIGDMQYSRIAGVGVNEFFVASIPYTEVIARDAVIVGDSTYYGVVVTGTRLYYADGTPVLYSDGTPVLFV